MTTLLLAMATIHSVATLRIQDFDVRITYPEGKGPFPVVVWSHGLGGSKDAYQPLARHWAEQGYVVIQPTHADSLDGRPLREKVSFMRGQGRSTENWAERPQQVTTILDALGSIQEKVPALKGKLDAKRIAVGGHSFGAHTAQLVAGTLPSTGRSLADPRPKAFIWISPQGTGPLFRPTSWQDVARPVLVVTGDNDDSPLNGKKAEWRMEAWRSLPEGDKTLVWVHGAHHGFGGISGRARFPGSGGPDPKQVAAVQRASTAFLDAYVKEERTAWQSLDLGPVARIERK